MDVLFPALLSVAMGAARAADPYATIGEIERLAAENGCVSAARALRARYDVTNAQCHAGVYKTSLPAKQVLTFSLDGRSYTLYVPVRFGDPAKPRRVPAPDEAPK